MRRASLDRSTTPNPPTVRSMTPGLKTLLASPIAANRIAISTIVCLHIFHGSGDAFHLGIQSSPLTPRRSRLIATSRCRRCADVSRSRCKVASTCPPFSSNSVTPSAASEALQTILGGEQGTRDFFTDVWQKTPRVYRNTRTDADHAVVGGVTKTDPYSRQVDMGLMGIVRALDNACQTFLEPLTAESQNCLPMVSRNKQCLSLQELAPLYGNDLFAAYMDGCSIIMNHVDRLCPNTASLCEDLQDTFPFAYANAYLTPPASQAVAAHADDRDVFVIQVYGQKAWKVYEDVPIEYPYPHEQVGKNGMAVPPPILEGPCSVDTVLRRGDVLYIPRGHVHEASTYPQGDDETIQPSFHITIALATFDWALSGLVATAAKKTLDEVPEYRMAIPLDVGMHYNAQDIPFEQRLQLENQIDVALEIVRKELTTERINDYLRQKYRWHTSKSRPQRLERIAQSQAISLDQQRSEDNAAILGPEAMKRITMESWVRPSSPDEQSLLDNVRPKQAPAIREETAEILSKILHSAQRAEPVQILQLLSLVNTNETRKDAGKYVCDLTLLSFIRSCVERGELSVVG